MAGSRVDPYGDHPGIKNWPPGERPREKLLLQGVEFLTDAELLALFIGSGTGTSTAVDVAKGLIAQQGDLKAVARMNAPEMIRIRGIGPAKAARILAAFEIGRRLESRKWRPDTPLRTPEDVSRQYGPLFRDLNHEEFYVILLDSGNRPIRRELISRGILNASLVHPREVFKTAVDHRAAGVVLIHNHPSGDPQPSREDRFVTRQVAQAGDILGIPVLDHIIVVSDRYFSFVEAGLMSTRMNRGR